MEPCMGKDLPLGQACGREAWLRARKGGDAGEDEDGQ